MVEIVVEVGWWRGDRLSKYELTKSINERALETVVGGPGDDLLEGN